MDQNTEVLDTQPEAQEGETPHVKALSLEEIAELEKRANVSSQNFERAKKAEEEKRLLQEENERLKEQYNSIDSFPDDTSKQVAELAAKLARMEEKAELDTLFKQYPTLADKRQEFDDYRSMYPKDKLPIVAKLFLAENDLLEETPKRKGLEKAGGGRKTTPMPAGMMSSEDVKRLRENNYGQYMKMLKSGKIQIG